MKLYVSPASARTLLVALLLLNGGGAAMAALGQAPAMAAPASAPSAVRMRVVTRAASGQYTKHEVLLASGTTVREYANPVGIVFAVSWKGAALPDLGTLLGDHYPSFKAQTDQARRAGMRRAPVNMERDGLVLQSMGHMRNFFGSAYVPALVPAGVSISNVLQ